jgi:hypothetical protein
MKVLKTIGYWFIQCTWGFIMTFIGAIVTFCLICAGKKPKHLGPMVYTKVGHNWGGLELGGFFICCEESGSHTMCHEAGHSLQNMILGPLFPFLVAIPSATRYWLREFKTHLSKSLFNLAYLALALTVTTLGAIIFGPVVPGFKWLTIVFEVLRIYFLIVSIWLSAIEIPKYDKGYVDYDSIWFEGQATKWGEKVFIKYL